MGRSIRKITRNCVFSSPTRVLGDTLIYSFPGANGSNAAQYVNKLLLSTSGLALINTLLESGKFSSLIGQISQLARSNNPVITDTSNLISLATPPTTTSLESSQS
ncbi:MAG: hypothetical protein ACHBN1_26760 [Heteroscytonema crispum UTEX LB 1556]